MVSVRFSEQVYKKFFLHVVRVPMNHGLLTLLMLTSLMVHGEKIMLWNFVTAAHHCYHYVWIFRLPLQQSSILAALFAIYNNTLLGLKARGLLPWCSLGPCHHFSAMPTGALRGAWQCQGALA